MITLCLSEAVLKCIVFNILLWNPLDIFFVELHSVKGIDKQVCFGGSNQQELDARNYKVNFKLIMF